MTKSDMQIIIVDDDRFICESVVQAMEIEGLSAKYYTNSKSVISAISSDFAGIIVSDIRMPEMDGLELHQHVKSIDRELPVILITGHGDIAMAVQAIRQGVYDFIEKPFNMGSLLDAVHRALDQRMLVLENRRLRSELAMQTAPGQKIIGESPSIRSLRSQIAKLSNTNVDILLWGETGTGKELVARSLHESSDRRKFPFVAINCGALPESIFESELFGHTAGAFTGASGKRVGKFEYASGGTVFLDEIESMPIELQVKLLRVLQDHMVEPLGSNKPIPVDIRVIAATKTDLKAASNKGKFREDLFYRLNVITLQLPTLRERKEDIADLFRHYLMIVAARYDSDIPEIDQERLQQLLVHDWPGNVRELKNYAERYLLMEGETAPPSEIILPEQANELSLHQRVEWFEKSMIEQALAQSRGVINGALEILDIPRKTLYEKMRKHQIDKKAFKEAS